MKKTLLAIIILGFFAGCEKDDDNLESFCYEDGNCYMCEYFPPEYVRVFEKFEKLGTKIHILEEKNSELLEYIKCNGHRFCFIEKIAATFIFKCESCGLRKSLCWDEMTCEQKNAYTKLCFSVVCLYPTYPVQSNEAKE